MITLKQLGSNGHFGFDLEDPTAATVSTGPQARRAAAESMLLTTQVDVPRVGFQD